MKMSIGNHARQSSPDRYSRSFCSTVSFAILHEGFLFARRFREVGWIQHCDVIVFEKFRFTVQNEEKTKTEFQKFPLWKEFSKSCVFGQRFHRIRVDGRPICKEKVALLTENGYAWTGF